MGYFFIDSIPHDAEYYPRGEFLLCYPTGNDQYDIDRLLNTVQVLDTRLTHDDLSKISESQFRPEIESLFEVVDKVETSEHKDVLLSLSLFRMHSPLSTTDKRFDAYLDGLKLRIQEIRKNHRDTHKIRVYVGNDIWDLLHREGLFESKDVEFYRMKDSSKRTEIGVLWRFLALDDYRYPFVSIEETDGHGFWEDGEWCTDDRSFRLKNLSVLKHDFESPVIDPHMRAMLLPFPPAEVHLEGNAMNAPCPLFFWAADNRLSDPLYMPRLSEFVQFGSPTLIRGPRRLPFENIGKLLCHHFQRDNTRIVYNPDLNIWTNMQERHPNLNFRFIDDHWLFHLTRVADTIFVLAIDEVERCHTELDRYGNDWFLKRMYDDLIEDGTDICVEDIGMDGTYTIKATDFTTTRFPLDWDRATVNRMRLAVSKQNDLVRHLTGFFVDRFSDGAQFVRQTDFVLQYETLTELINNLQMVDPRVNHEDIPVLESTRSEYLRLFEIDDKIESQHRGDALCSLCIFEQPQVRRREPFSWFLEGLVHHINRYRDVQSNHKLRVYVGYDAWNTLHGAHIFDDAPHVDFIRMRQSCANAMIGTLWRLLAFDDYDYEFVYLDDTDKRVALDEHGNKVDIEPLLVDNEILERRFSGLKDEVHIASALSTGVKDLPGNFFVEYPHASVLDVLNQPTPFHHIFAPDTYYQTQIFDLTRGPLRMPFDSVVPFLCAMLDKSPKHIVFDRNSNSYSSFNEVMSCGNAYAPEEGFAFFMSKLLNIKAWFREDSIAWLRALMERYGNRCFYRRIHEQLISDGNHLMRGNEGVEAFSFDDLSEV